MKVCSYVCSVCGSVLDKVTSEERVEPIEMPVLGRGRRKIGRLLFEIDRAEDVCASCQDDGFRGAVASMMERRQPAHAAQIGSMDPVDKAAREERRGGRVRL